MFLSGYYCCWLIFIVVFSGSGLVCWLKWFLVLFFYEAMEGIIGMGSDFWGVSLRGCYYLQDNYVNWIR